MIDLRHENDTSTLRTDGRKLNETRQVSFELGTMRNTNGSAIFTIGNTRVAAFVQGPHQVCILYLIIISLKFAAYYYRLTNVAQGRLSEVPKARAKEFSTCASFRQISAPWSTRRISRRTWKWKNFAEFSNQCSNKLWCLSSTLEARLTYKYSCCRPTAATAPLLSMPSRLLWWMQA